MINGIFIPPWLAEQCKRHGIDASGCVVISNISPLTPTLAEQMRKEFSVKVTPQAYLNINRKGKSWAR